jgi:hypothetical protein
MAIVVKLTGDLSDLEAKLKSAGVKVESFGDNAETAGKQASGAFSSDLENKIARIEEATQRSAEATETLASHAGGMNALAEGFGNTERLALGANDIMGVMAEQFGINLGPAQEYAQAMGDVAGGLEGVIGGGMALGQQLIGVPATLGPAIASTWAHVTALYAQAAAFIAANLPMIALIATVALVAAGVVLLIQHWDDVTAKFPILGEIVDTVKEKLAEFGNWITGTFVPAVASLYDPAIKVPLDLIIAYFKMQFDIAKVIVETALGVIKGVVDIFMGIFTGDWQRAWDGVKAVVESLWTGIKDVFNLGIKFFRDELIPTMLEVGEKLGNALMDGIKKALGAVAGFAGGIADAVLSAVKGVVNNFVIDPINRTLEFGFDTHIPGVGTVNINPPDLPRLASGMWNVPGPTGVDQFPALLAGGEMVVPAKEAEAFRQFFSAGGGGGNNTITVRLASDGIGHTVEELERLRKLVNNLDDESRRMWFADARNQDTIRQMTAAGFLMNEDNSISNPNQAPQDVLVELLAALATYSEEFRNAWWSRPENIAYVQNLKNRIAGLPNNGAGPGQTTWGGWGTPGAEGGAVLGGLPKPTVGGSGGTSNNKPVATTPGGALKADEEMLQLARDSKRNGDQMVDLLKHMWEMRDKPQLIELMMKPGALQALAQVLFDPLAQIARRQGGLTA